MSRPEAERARIVKSFGGYAVQVLGSAIPCVWDPTKFNTVHIVRQIGRTDLERLRDDCEKALADPTFGAIQNEEENA
jgi:hypothetical protein